MLAIAVAFKMKTRVREDHMRAKIEELHIDNENALDKVTFLLWYEQEIGVALSFE